MCQAQFAPAMNRTYNEGSITSVSAPGFHEPINPGFGVIFETRNPGIFWCETWV